MILSTQHADPSVKALNYSEKQVEIQGTIRLAAGYQGIEIHSIKELGGEKKLTL